MVSITPLVALGHRSDIARPSSLISVFKSVGGLNEEGSDLGPDPLHSRVIITVLCDEARPVSAVS